MNWKRLEPTTRTGSDVRAMFAGIAARYDLLNTVLSAGLDRGWRKLAVRRALAGQTRGAPFRDRCTVVDVCCGTGDLALTFRAAPNVARVIGLDFVPEMVVRAKGKTGPGAVPADYATADAHHLPLGDASADVVSIAFGLRNLVDPPAGIREFARVLRPGGRLVVLEFFRPPDGLLGRSFRLYFRHVLPRIGRLLSGYRGVDAYRYLPESVEAFASPEEVDAWIRAAGLVPRSRDPLAFGSVQCILAEKQ